MAMFFWTVTGVLWLVVTHGVLAVLTVQPDKPSLAAGLNGGWLVCVVATQSLSILTVLILPSSVSADLQQPLMFAALALWLSGGALYMWLITLIFSSAIWAAEDGAEWRRQDAAADFGKPVAARPSPCGRLVNQRSMISVRRSRHVLEDAPAGSARRPSCPRRAARHAYHPARWRRAPAGHTSR